MISSRYRFHARGGVNFVYKNGQRAKGTLMSMVFVRPNKRKESRFGVVVSKKVLKSAVGRNRIRRRVYAVIESFRPRIKENIDVLIKVQKADVRDVDFAILKAELEQLLKKAEII